MSPARLLRRLVLIEEGETPALLWASAYFFLLLFGYYLVRPVREAIGIARGADKLPWLMTGTLIVLVLASPAFSALVSRLPRRRFIPWTYRFFALHMLAFFLAFRYLPDHGGPVLGYAFYIWLSVFNLFVVSVFWGLMSDLWNEAQGKRLFGFLALGGTLARTATFARLDFWVNLLTLGVQVFFTGRIIRWLGIPVTLSILPLLSLAGFAALWLWPTFGVGPVPGAASGSALRSGSSGPGDPLHPPGPRGTLQIQTLHWHLRLPQRGSAGGLGPHDPPRAVRMAEARVAGPATLDVNHLAKSVESVDLIFSRRFLSPGSIPNARLGLMRQRGLDLTDAAASLRPLRPLRSLR